MSASDDAYLNHARAPGDPARRAAMVTPGDGTDLSPWAKALYLGQGGDLKLIPAGSDDPVTLKNRGTDRADAGQSRRAGCAEIIRRYRSPRGGSLLERRAVETLW